MKIIVTGSHFTPAQAVIEELKKDSNIKITYVGRKYTREGDKSPSVESQVLPNLGVKFSPIITGRLQRSFTRYTIPSLFKIPIGIIQSFLVLLKEKPDVVLSFGGYVSVPVVFSAWLLSIPIIIHEQTLVPGLANTISSLFADKIAVTFKDSKFKGGKVVVTGNPLREEIFADQKRINTDIQEIINNAQREKLPLVLITGGNQGSHVINEAVGGSLEKLTQNMCIIHQTGDSKFQDFEKLKELGNNLNFPSRYLVKKWIEPVDWGELFRKVDLVVSRAGMNTLLEVCYFSKPILIIPIPVKEQMTNAKYFQKLGNAKVLWQKDLDNEKFLSAVKDGLVGLDEGIRKAKEIIIPDAANRLALETILLGNKGNKVN